MIIAIGILIYVVLFGGLWLLLRGSKDTAFRFPESSFDDRTP